ncbi:pyrimidine dimer DNA glycosylase/endonuclease V [Paeniglutamicibacter sp. NPDC091659]|uniref:pyrimidine dimer DNA glycosylase/endonuclease V n=1 Tax=Paeniglutamicibacter sp. NPDC091659 TaxID=3364389 RepID=UPI00380A462F
MRLWSLHPRYLDTKGLLACWRETLLAQKVLAGGTTGYRNHPQLERFRATADPLATVGTYLEILALEADARGYNFNRGLILRPPLESEEPRLPVTSGQVAYEREHLLAKLAVRDSHREAMLAAEDPPALHPLFEAVPGDIESWERPSN